MDLNQLKNWLNKNGISGGFEPSTDFSYFPSMKMQPLEEDPSAEKTIKTLIKHGGLIKQGDRIWFLGDEDPNADRYNLNEVDWTELFGMSGPKYHLYRVTEMMAAIYERKWNKLRSVLKRTNSPRITPYDIFYDVFRIDPEAEDGKKLNMTLHYELSKACFIRISGLLLETEIPEDIFLMLMEAFQKGADLGHRWFFWSFSYPGRTDRTVTVGCFRSAVEKLFLLQKQKPDLFERIMCEELYCEILFSFCKLILLSDRNKKDGIYFWFITSIKKIASGERLYEFWRMLFCSLANGELHFRFFRDPGCLKRFERIKEFWLDLTGKKIVFNLRDKECGAWFYQLFCHYSSDYENTPESDALSILLRITDRIIPSEEDEEELEITKDILCCNEPELLMLSLKKNLFSSAQMSEMIRLARENHRQDYIPLLVLKKQGSMEVSVFR